MNRPILWISNTTNPDGADPYGRALDYLKDPAKWVSGAFAMAKRMGFDLLIAQPRGHAKDYPVQHGTSASPGDYRAGLFLEPEANRQFLIERDAWQMSGVKLACGIYMGRWLTDTIRLDPSNKHTQDYMAGPLLPFLTPGSILGVDGLTTAPADSQRLCDACTCFGVRYYQEGMPYGAWPGKIPSLGIMSQALVVDPLFKCKVPAGLDMRLRIGMGDVWGGPKIPLDKYTAAVAQLKANGFGIDVLAWVGDLQPEDWAALDLMAGLATGAGVTT